MRGVALLLLAFLAMPAGATTYYFVGGAIHLRTDHTTCGTGTCADFPAGGRATGSFTTAAPLAANLPAADRSGAVTGFGFSDGVTAYSSANPNARLFKFELGTDASGVPTSVSITIQQWQADAPHDAGNSRFDVLVIGSIVSGAKNTNCTAFGASPDTGVPDSCTSGSSATTDTSAGGSTLPWQWSIDVPIAVPPNVATTYYFASGAYTTRIPHATCSTGACADFPLGGRVAGSFTTAARIPDGIALTEISGLLTGYQIVDGPTTYSMSDAQSRAVSFQVATGATGVPVAYSLQLQRWQAAGPHAVGDRVDVAALTTGPFVAVNLGCNALGFGDTCLTPGALTDDGSLAYSLLATRSAIGAPPSAPLVPTTYTLSTGPYATIANHATCTSGVCSDFMPAMRIAGTFTLADRLPAGFALDEVAGLVASYAITDGVTTFSSADPLAQIVGFRLAIGPGGVPVDAAIGISRWQGGAAPHVAGDHLDLVTVAAGGGIGAANAHCTTGAARSAVTGALDACLGIVPDGDASLAYADDAPTTFAVAGAGGRSAAAVPATSGSAIALLAALLAVLAAWPLATRSGQRAQAHRRDARG